MEHRGFCAAVVVLALLAGCAPLRQPATIPVQGSEEGLRVLAGDWRGEYANSEGRVGTITFSLEADEMSAKGDVFMIPPRRPDPTGVDVSEPAEGGPPPGARHLHIEFVRVEEDDRTIRGTLEPYIDPLCDCAVTTVFEGRIEADRIEGTFVTRRGEGRPTANGRWRVERTTRRKRSGG
jgi:hypothetical protein